MTQDKTPTPEEIDALIARRWPAFATLTLSPRQWLRDAVLDALARWGSPVVAGDVDRADAVNLARNALTQYDCAITKKGVRVLAEAVLSMDSALTTPQPSQAQAGAVPLTPEQCNDLPAASFCVASVGDPTATLKPEDAERIITLLHSLGGIKGGQHGS